jgi:hypothetical protein
MVVGALPSHIKITLNHVNTLITRAARVHMLNADVKITPGGSLSNSQRIAGEANANPSLSSVEVIFNMTYLKPRRCRTLIVPSYPGRKPGQRHVKITVFGNSLVNSLSIGWI